MALLLPSPLDAEVDGLRRALGAGALGRVPPHLTLVPPVNVRQDELALALAVVRKAAGAQRGPLHVRLGPPATFAPNSPVVHLPAQADAPADLARLHQMALTGPLFRPEKWDWVPHVTLADDADVERIGASLTALASFVVEVDLARLALMEEEARVWAPLADVYLGAPVVVGRGGLPLQMWEGSVLGPDGAALLDESGLSLPEGHRQQVVLTGMRDEELVGVAVAWAVGRPGERVHVAVIVEREARGQGVGRALLQALEMSVRRQGWQHCSPVVHGPAEFYTRSSSWMSSS